MSIGAPVPARVDAATKQALLGLLAHAVGQGWPVVKACRVLGLDVRRARRFMAMVAIAQHFGRPATPTDQAWIESLNGTVKIEWPHLHQIKDPAELRAELEHIRLEYNTSRLHSGIGYVTPNDEHEGRGEAIRAARRAGLQRAAQARLAYHREQRNNQHNPEDPDVV